MKNYTWVQEVDLKGMIGNRLRYVSTILDSFPGEIIAEQGTKYPPLVLKQALDRRIGTSRYDVFIQSNSSCIFRGNLKRILEQTKDFRCMLKFPHRGLHLKFVEGFPQRITRSQQLISRFYLPSIKGRPPYEFTFQLSKISFPLMSDSLDYALL